MKIHKDFAVEICLTLTLKPNFSAVFERCFAKYACGLLPCRKALAVCDFRNNFMKSALSGLAGIRRVRGTRPAKTEIETNITEMFFVNSPVL